MQVKGSVVYLRKSRGDEEKDLQKHRNTLVELCTNNQWKYIEYAEIGTSDSIEMRPIFMKLLNDIKADIYDAIVVMDYDRLSRGSKSEQGNIEDIIKNSNTLIITPNKVYDLNNDLDATYSDFQGLFARFEYKTITRRLKQGKLQVQRWETGLMVFQSSHMSIKSGMISLTKKGLLSMMIN